jgi:hypothetical protein
LVFKNYAKMNDIRNSAQKEAIHEYNAFQKVLHRHVK